LLFYFFPSVVLSGTPMVFSTCTIWKPAGARPVDFFYLCFSRLFLPNKKALDSQVPTEAPVTIRVADFHRRSSLVRATDRRQNWIVIAVSSQNLSLNPDQISAA
jgi:hypothetical protein